MKNNNGFTLLEIALVTVILGLLAGVSIMKYLHVRANELLQKTANNLYIEIRSLRPLCFRFDERVMLTFNTSTNQCKIYVDENDDDTVQESELHHVFDVAAPVEIGVCDETPADHPFQGSPFPDYTPTNGLAVQWKNTGMVTVDPDSRGNYSHGAVYLYVPSLKKICYFIGITTKMQSIELWKWNGSSWIKL
jgi:prepilin-type N-terminal cleavage/methylation domain-containing protein